MINSNVKFTVIVLLLLALITAVTGTAVAEEKRDGNTVNENKTESLDERKNPVEADKGADLTDNEKKATENESRPALSGDGERLPARRGPTGFRQFRGIGFVDLDGDGINDLFRDVNGDGINDVDGKPYPHRFKFVDADGDGINDIFVDADGDGINDLDPSWVDADGDGICDNVIDSRGRFINDITGERYSRRNIRGTGTDQDRERARPRMMMRNFIDENADGIPDASRGRMGPGGPQEGSGPGRDNFIDRNGNGIDDRREHMLRMWRGQKK